MEKIGRIITILTERLETSPEVALDLFYSSKTNEHLHNPETGLYLLSDRYIAENVVREYQN